MPSTEFQPKTAFYSSALRQELCARNRAYARRHGLQFCESYGSLPVIAYEPDESLAVHGNFQGESYKAIRENSGWQRRLEKVHPQGRSSLPKTARKWCELDSSMSSDALLMNIFCHPGTLIGRELCLMLGISPGLSPEFGVRARVPLANGSADRTEIDMRVGNPLVEAKLTESDFQRKSKEVVRCYRDLAEVFDEEVLPQSESAFDGYQLVRNILAAYATDSSFCVMVDARRPDLVEQWYGVLRAVRNAEMRVRCKVATWQELSALLPRELQDFLDEKYGIVAPGATPSVVADTGL